MTEVQLEIMNSCMLSCRHCSSADTANGGEAGYAFVDVLHLLNCIQGPAQVYLTGGEPLLHSDLPSYVRALREAVPKIRVGIFTSGIVTEGTHLSCISTEYATTLMESGLSAAYISFYHSNPSYHDAITNCPGALSLVQNSINTLIAAGVVVKIHLVLNRYNINELPQIVAHLATLGVSEVRLLRLVKVGNANAQWDTIGVSYDDQNAAIEKVFKSKDKFHCELTFSGFPAMTACRPHSTAEKCQAGTRLFYVTFKGDIFPCACTRSSSSHKIAHLSEREIIARHFQGMTYENLSTCLNPLR